ncbi:MAG: WYL domain-containing protein [Gammaproteobacteria bacterium]|nr:WYL domain-containing protein [Gammaproteobacteria bacterium]
MDQFDRVFRLHRLLSAHRATGVSFDALLDELREHEHKSTKSTLKRALRFMRDRLQAPLIHDRERGGYRYEGDGAFELPGLWFTAQELAALLVLETVAEQQPLGLLSEALKPCRARVERLLQKSGIGVPDWRSRLRLLRMAARSPGSQFAVVAEALAGRRQLRIDYHARSDDRMTPRTVSPQRLTLYRDNWYLDAWCHTRQDLRTFALDRIIATQALDEPAQDVPAEQLHQTLATSYGIFSGQPTATAALRFSAHAARWVAAETWHPQQQDTHDDDGRLTRRLPYHRSEELVMDILRHGPEVEVLAPAGLRKAVIQRLRQALSVYGAPAFVDAAPADAMPARFGSTI